MTVRRLMLAVMIILLTAIMISLAQKVLLFRQAQDDVGYGHMSEMAH
ncbi:MAG: hypothetical protein AAYR33_00720 [Acetobacteraceae bacterium]